MSGMFASKSSTLTAEIDDLSSHSSLVLVIYFAVTLSQVIRFSVRTMFSLHSLSSSLFSTTVHCTSFIISVDPFQQRVQRFDCLEQLSLMLTRYLSLEVWQVQIDTV